VSAAHRTPPTHGICANRFLFVCILGDTTVYLLRMFGWFTSSSGPTAEQRAWADARIAWVLEQFGRDCVRKCPAVVPTPEFFPDAFQGREEDVAPMLRRVCGYMSVDPKRVQLYLYSDDDPDLGPGFHLAGERDRTAGLHQGGEVA